VQEFRVLYVDNAGETVKQWLQLLPDLVVKQDPWHLIMRICRTVNSSSDLYLGFRAALSRALFTLYPPDLQKVASEMGVDAATASKDLRVWLKCRKAIPDGTAVYEKLKGVLEAYTEKGQQVGEDFINSETWKALENQKELILKNYLTGGACLG
jgi:hypothetical protein